MPKKKKSLPPAGNGAAFIIIIAALVVALVLLLIWKQKQQQLHETPPQQTAELISDDGIIYGGMPRARQGAGDEVTFEVLKNQAYIVGYSESRKDPLWSAYRVLQVAHPNHLPRPSGFSSDPRTTARVKESDFSRTGYDRGHMTPNEAIAEDFGAAAQLETFRLSNICPQAPSLNRDVWEKLEADERKFANQFEEIWVIDGPVFADLNGGATSRLASGIAVPSAFYKILIDEEGHPGGPPRIFSVIMPQTVKGTELPQEFLTSVSEIEKETHLDFLWKLDPATRQPLESKTWPMW
jgi:endonuclease G